MRFRLFLALALIVVSSCTTTRTIPSAPSVVQASAKTPVVELDGRSNGPSVGADVYGANVATWYDFRQPFVNPSMRKTGIKLVRFPGGSESDAYHWQHGGTLCDQQGSVTPGDSFDTFMTHLVEPLHLDVAITLNYGSNRACNGGGEPSEAGAWVLEAKRRGYHVAHWTVGNEDYGSWEYDLHAKPHDPTTYADAVRTAYYPAVKKANANAQLGIVVDLPSDRAWNDVVLSKAQPFDFVELHYYPEYKIDNDGALLGTDIDKLARYLSELRSEMNEAGVPKSVPIYLGEYNNDAAQEGKQSVSIVNGLYLGQVVDTLMNAGIPMATWWLAYGSCDEKGDYSKKLYGWQHFGSEALFSDALPDPYEGCSDTPKIAGGTPFPTARVMALLSSAIPAGTGVRTTTVSPSIKGNVRAYGFAEGRGYAFALFNNTLSPIAIDANVKSAGKTKFAATLTAYGKAQYDNSKENKWIGPVKRNLGNVGTTIPLTLPPYSVSVLTLT